MPPPPVPPAKRKRMSSTFSGSSSGSNASNFSEGVKIETRRQTGDTCWNCGAFPLDVYHVFAKEDYLLEPLLRSRGLLNFDLMSTDNAIALCRNCHANFDDTGDPGFFFIPADLDYFIQFEQNDYARRIREASKGVKAARICPDGASYLKHQAAAGAVLEDSSGGLYRRILLKSYIPYMPQTQIDEPKPWHGNPIGAIRRGIMATGTMRVDRFPPQVCTQLRELQELYSRPDPDPSVAAPRSGATGVFRQVGDDATNPDINPPTHANPDNAEPGNNSVSQTQNVAPARSGSSAWTLGPNFSTEDTVQRYQHLLEYPAV